MQADFHFYAIYALARAAGFNPENANKIAQSSQYTDEAKDTETYIFETGGRYQPVPTAHKFFSIKSISDNTCFEIWTPFHFLPGGAGNDFHEKMIARANSAVSRKLIENFLNLNPTSYSLYHLGIILHVYADTWSHQNFMGLRNDLNDVIEVKNFTDEMLKKKRQEVVECWAPKVGHAQAATLPDIPYLEWEYRDYKGAWLEVSNLDRSVEAGLNCFSLLCDFLNQNPGYSTAQPISSSQIKAKLQQMFRIEDDLNSRIEKWKRSIAGGDFGFEEANIVIDHESCERWKYLALDIKGEDYDLRYTPEPNFKSSDWALFNAAAAHYKFFVTKELLPGFDLHC